MKRPTYRRWTQLCASSNLLLMRVFVFISVFCMAMSETTAQTSNLSFTAIPYSDPDMNRPGAGAEQWNDQNMSAIPVAGTNTRRLDKYFRFSWSMFETTQGNYTWSKFDQEINDAISKGQKFSFGIMTHYPDAASGHRVNYDGGYAVYPQYLHNLMQAESPKDWKASNGAWVPNWNSPAYLARLLALNQAINNHINTTSYNGVAYKNVINYIDIRGYGAYGEWHSYTIADNVNTYPAGTRATSASLKKIIDAHTQAFPNFPLVIMVSAFDGNRLPNTMNPPDVAQYALTTSNNWGKIGWRRDNWGATDTYLRTYTDQNTITVNGMRLDTAIMNRWKYALVVGEPCCNANYSDLETQVKRYHAVSFGNGNFSPNSTIDPNMRAASKAAGYRLILEGGSIASTIKTGSSFPLTLLWKNTGVTPTYEDWDVLYELKNSSGTVVWSTVSSFKPKMFLPESSAKSVTDNLTIPTSVAAGSYTLTLKVRDADGFRAPLPLAISGKNSDGSYTIKAISITTGSGSSNTAPVANAGSAKTITLPTNSVSLSGSASSDADGSISSYQWQQVSGPSTSTIATANSVNTTVSNLVAGTYSYRLTVTDNNGSTGTATVSVTVNSASNAAPVANAGSNRTITLPTSSTSLSGSGSTDANGTISTYLWQQVSGPSTSTIATPNAVNTTVSNLRAGVYTYRLTVTDNGGATGTANVTVTVNSGANTAPVANAGAAQTITLPTNSLTLNGSGSSDADGTIASYLWQKTSGGNATISSSSSVSTRVSNLVAGTYVFRLTVTDNSGASATSNVTITVNAAGANTPPVANAGPDRTITLPTSTASLSGAASSDANGTLTGYLWQQISGPSTSTIAVNSAVTATVSNLRAGVYTYRLTVTDNNGATASDEVKVTVNGAANAAPVANAGSAQTVILPANSASLSGSSSTDADGTISSYQWQQVSGPSTASFSSTTSANVTVRSLVAGTYVFRLTVTDNNGATGTATVNVTVRSNSVTNQYPVPNPGAAQTIRQPATTATLNGNASYDPDGSITTYIWQQVSGPSTSSLSSTYGAVVTARNLNRTGDYVFKLSVQDNGGLWNGATVKVTVRSSSSARGVVGGDDSTEIVETVIIPDTIAATAETGKDITAAGADAVSLYPNPAESVVNLVLNTQEAGKVRVNIYGATGQRAMQPLEFNKTQGYITNQINVSALKAGTYMLEIVSADNTRKVLKFVKL